MKLHMKWPSKKLLPLLLLLPLLGLTGCAMFEWAVAAMAPPEEAKATFDLPKDKRILVFPDDQSAPLPYPPFKRMLANKINAELMDHKLASETIPYDRIVDLQAGNSDFDRLPVDETGSKLGADLVIFMQMGEFRLKDNADDPLWHGRATAFIRVVDVHTGQRLWPALPQEGFALSVETDASDNSDASYGAQLTEQMATSMGDQIAKLFYKHTVEKK